MADYGIYEGIEQIFNLCGAKIVCDSVFNVSDADYLIKSAQTDPLYAELLRINREATSIRQLSEWGMQMIKGSFPRLEETLFYEEKGDRHVILRLMVNLYNFTCSNVDMNIIQNSYMKKINYFGHQGIDNCANGML